MKSDATFTIAEQVKAWSVHLLTATGMVVGFKALQLAFSGETYSAVLLLLLTVAIDGIDGTLARKFRVQEVLPHIDGKMMDFVIDFVNFVITPLIVFYEEKMLPEPFLFPAVAMMLYASLYHYSNKKQVTEDFYFRGFPAFWNLVIYFLFILALPKWANGLIVAIFVLAHFLPIRFLYLTRMQHNVLPAVVLLVLLIGANTYIMLVYPEVSDLLKLLAVAPLIGLFAIGFMRRELFGAVRLFRKTTP